jgi:hypothetical protein
MEEYAGTLLQTLLSYPESASGQLTADEGHTMLTQIAEGSDKLPSVPTSAFTREASMRTVPSGTDEAEYMGICARPRWDIFGRLRFVPIILHTIMCESIAAFEVAAPTLRKQKADSLRE